MTLRTTPDRPLTVADLGEDEILVTDATPDCPGGLDGLVYAIPTDVSSTEALWPYIEAFIDLASEWDQTTFIVERLGLEHGFSDADVALLFDRVLDLYNVVLPEAYLEILLSERRRSGRPLPTGIED